MKSLLRTLPAWVLIFVTLSLTSFFTPGALAQVSKSRHKTSNPYRNSYQRFFTGSTSTSTYEIRDGALYAWGNNASGQLGDGTNTDKPAPILVDTDTRWVSIASGYGHSIALKSDGTLWAWGYNFYGGLGDGTTAGRNTPIQIGADTKWVSIAAGAAHTIALKSDGSLWAWGYNSNGQLGDGTSNDSHTPTRIGTDTKWVSIAAGAYHSMALKSDGTLWAWGDNSTGQLGDGTTTGKYTPTRIGTDTRWVGIAGGFYHTIAVKSDGTLWTWGGNSYGQLGDGTFTDKNIPTRIGTDNKWVSIACGITHSIAVKSDGTLWAWGYNNYGQLGDGTTGNKDIPTRVGTDNKWVNVAGGTNHTVALKSDGTLWAWGLNSTGQLGDGTTTNKSTPIQVRTDPRNWLRVVHGNLHSIALKSNGTLWAWGYNLYGQLGDGSTIDKTTPAQIGDDTKWVNIAWGGYHNIATKSDGTLWAWGNNSNGQLGDSTYIDKYIPTQIGTDNKWVNVAGGVNHTIALKSDGTLWAWGYNNNGQLGNGTNNGLLIPTRIGTDDTWVSIACGEAHTVALKSDGSLWAWGFNNNGQLGDGTTTSKSVLTRIGTDTTWVSIACGNYHTIALKSDGTLWAWGYNNYGQLGDGTTSSKSVPTRIGTDTTWVSIAGGYAHTTAIMSDGSLWGWGYNGGGQLGDGTTASKTTPTLISSQSNVVALASGGSNYHSGIIKSTRGSICLTGTNSNGQLGDGSVLDKINFNCSNRVCRQYSLVTAASTSYTQPLTGVANRTDFQDACALAAAVTPSGASPVTNNVTTQAFIDASVQFYNGQPYVQRHYDIYPVANPNTATATITLYFTQAEFNAYNTAAGATALQLPVGPADTTGIANLRLTQYHGTASGGYAPSNYSATWGGAGPAHVGIDPIDANIVWNSRDSRWEVTFDVTGFSGFFVYAGNNIFPLPVKLLSFTAQKAGAQRNRLDWTTATETPGTTFAIERSGNGSAFASIGNTAGKGSEGTYTFYDEQPLANINYYRLKITERGSAAAYSNTVVLRSSDDHSGSVTVAPVPASDAITITNTDASLIGSTATVRDMQGREVYRFVLSSTGMIDVSGWSAGIYMLRLATGDVVRIVKQ